MIAPLILAAAFVSTSAHVVAQPPLAAGRQPVIETARSADGARNRSRVPDHAGQTVRRWAEGARFGLETAPGQVSDIALQPGESLISVAAGDTVRWVIGDTVSGSGSGRRTHILVKPTQSGLRGNLVIATDRRVYHVELSSVSRTAMLGLSWSYPPDDLMALTRGAQSTGGPDILLEMIAFNYRIDGDRPAWRPLRAFDDGRQVFIEFPASLDSGEAPPLFVVGSGGKAELVNYRVRGRYYVVDRLFDTAELRLGERRQLVVRISRTASRRDKGTGR